MVRRALKIVGAFVAFLCIFLGAFLVRIFWQSWLIHPPSDYVALLGVLGVVLCCVGLTYLWAIKRPQ